ncbi:hypothetical protein CAPTEDRAFT_227478 [Capitella teleta]|uniref:C2 domain-containing protein n=1 Tax=Capitella teleta TaxID=283909 RepID=R7UYG1_CAPTE|nr:hypothetical protein CAPTEDRAFT_227478 [Capitella teleta]|eukprot:ELU11603.1 hypothetical protein CAPTEDRAFT_227478 [Capitella teleta]
MAQYVTTAGAAAIPATKVEISVSCRKLQDKDTFSKSDPMCVLYTKPSPKSNFLEYGRTEMIKDSLNPDFVKKFIMDYYFEESQKLRFEMRVISTDYDVDSPSSKLDKHDFLGCLECTLGQIVGSPSNRLDKPLQGSGGKKGTITVRAEEISSCKDVITLHFKATKLDKKDLFGKSDPFLVFSRSNEDGSYTVVHRTEVIKNTLNPTWKPFTVKVRSLCNGDLDRSIQIECYDWDSDGSSHDLIGIFSTTVRELSKGPCPSTEYEVIHPKKKAKKKNYKHSGTVYLMSSKIEKEHSFLDFIQGGMQLNFTVAIDFTASNGDPRTSTSLHYINPYQPTQYAVALQAVGNIIQDYDSDKMFPALGFGAKLPNGQVSHEFPLNGNPQNPFCSGIAGVLDSYQRTIQAVQLYGPTNFSPVINHVARFGQANQDGSNYFVLLILTDGVITDFPQTKDAIVQASSLPVSIIIVGVGNADFDAMEELDADNHRLMSHGKAAERDIVQFVPFREFLGRHGNDLAASEAHLAKEVLAEIPDQIVGYMKKRGILPKPPPPAYDPQTAGQAPSAPPPPQGPMW